MNDEVTEDEEMPTREQGIIKEVVNINVVKICLIHLLWFYFWLK